MLGGGAPEKQGERVGSHKETRGCDQQLTMPGDGLDETVRAEAGPFDRGSHRTRDSSERGRDRGGVGAGPAGARGGFARRAAPGLPGVKDAVPGRVPPARRW